MYCEEINLSCGRGDFPNILKLESDLKVSEENFNAFVREILFIYIYKQANHACLSSKVSRCQCRDDCYIPNEADVYVTVKPYESYDETQLRLNFYARIIQRNYRAYRWMKYIRECARVYRDMLERCKRHEEEKAVANK